MELNHWKILDFGILSGVLSLCEFQYLEKVII
ncbi:ribosomal protein L11 methyltransferase [Vibrio cholerae]|nr:ribosomal protein L11 methyltransferase [Vibrio cholerae]